MMPLWAKFSTVRVEQCSFSATCFLVSSLPVLELCSFCIAKGVRFFALRMVGEYFQRKFPDT